MEPRFFSILGLAATRDLARSGLNDPTTHRDDTPWVLGDIPDDLVAAFRPRPAERAATPLGCTGRSRTAETAHAAS